MCSDACRFRGLGPKLSSLTLILLLTIVHVTINGINTGENDYSPVTAGGKRNPFKIEQSLQLESIMVCI